MKLSLIKTRAAAIVALLPLIAPAALAQNAASDVSELGLSTGFKFTEDTGAKLYANVCQGCHMPDGKGAIGAGAYPSIASDKKLETGGYPIYIVVNGQRAMPPVGGMMNDDQVATVVNYVRTHFGNEYQDTVTAADVKAVRR
jgi:mono/diheme cytochrome c family protein